MNVGEILSLVVIALIAGSLLVSGGLSAYFSADNYTVNGTMYLGNGLMGLVMPLVPVGLGLVVLAYAFKKSGIKF